MKNSILNDLNNEMKSLLIKKNERKKFIQWIKTVPMWQLFLKKALQDYCQVKYEIRSGNKLDDLNSLQLMICETILLTPLQELNHIEFDIGSFDTFEEIKTVIDSLEQSIDIEK